jgi:putative tryptophan/tyrosine transport system substrate-binding protein
VAAPGLAQQAAMPVIGFLNSQSPEGYAGPLRGFHQGLKDSGYVECRPSALVGQNELIA